MDRLEEAFARLSGCEATRRAGQVYAGRTLLYEDCQRHFDLRFGPHVHERIGPALTLILTSARWYTYTVAERYRAVLDEIYDRLCEQTSSDRVDYLRFCDLAAPVIAIDETGGNALIDEVSSEVRRRWAAIFALRGDERHVSFTSAELRARVDEAFTAPHPGWPIARFHSPDLMMASDDKRDLWVLGEIHTGSSTLLTPLVLRESPHADALLDVFRDFIGVQRVAPVASKSIHTRLDFGPSVAYEYEIELGGTRSDLPRERVLAAADLVVVRTSGGLAVQTRDGKIRIDVIACLERNLIFSTASGFSLCGGAQHVPRLTIDDLVVARQTWRFVSEELTFAREPLGLEQFTSARRWATQHEIPRYVFVRVPEERKPMFVDLASPLYVEMFAKLVRGASRVTVSEMLPTHDQLWLTDHEGRRYTAELRITAVDRVPWQAKIT
jgi:hypothetical protein